MDCEPGFQFWPHHQRLRGQAYGTALWNLPVYQSHPHPLRSPGHSTQPGSIMMPTWVPAANAGMGVKHRKVGKEKCLRGPVSAAQGTMSPSHAEIPGKVIFPKSLKNRSPTSSTGDEVL